MIVLGADVGTTTGLALLDCGGAKPRYLDACAIRDDLIGVMDVRLFGMHTIAAVGIETPAQVFEHGRAAESEGARRSIERALLVARDAAGQVRAVASMRAPRANVHDGQAHHVRRAVLGKLPREHLDRFIAQWVPLLIDGWPRTSNSHQRDAAVVALWAWQRERAGLAPGEPAPRSKKRDRVPSGLGGGHTYTRGADRERARERCRMCALSRPPKLTALDLRDAAERVLRPRDACSCRRRGAPSVECMAAERISRNTRPQRSEGCSCACHPEHPCFQRPNPDGDPGEERAAAMLVGCPSCDSGVGQPCIPITGERLVLRAYGVHKARAAAAGHRGITKPAKAPPGPRKMAERVKVKAWAVFAGCKPCVPCGGGGLWSGCVGVVPATCTACGATGRQPVPWSAFDAVEPAPLVRMTAPCECGHGKKQHHDGYAWCGALSCICMLYVPRGGIEKITMRGREWSREGVKCWLYEPA